MSCYVPLRRLPAILLGQHEQEVTAADGIYESVFDRCCVEKCYSQKEPVWSVLVPKVSKTPALTFSSLCVRIYFSVYERPTESLKTRPEMILQLWNKSEAACWKFLSIDDSIKHSKSVFCRIHHLVAHVNPPTSLAKQHSVALYMEPCSHRWMRGSCVCDNMGCKHLFCSSWMNATFSECQSFRGIEGIDLPSVLALLFHLDTWRSHTIVWHCCTAF